MGVRVISLFDGISVGYSALIREGFVIEKYYASEIDRFAIAVSAANHPDIVQVGCIQALNTRALAKLGRIDILLAAPPCQGFSPAGKRRGFDHAQSRLYYDFLRVLREVKPTWCLIENVASPQLIKALKNDLGGSITPIVINSALVSPTLRSGSTVAPPQRDSAPRRLSRQSAAAQHSRRSHRPQALLAAGTVRGCPAPSAVSSEMVSAAPSSG